MPLALDGVSGLTMACGLRRLLTAYAGNCVQVTGPVEVAFNGDALHRPSLDAAGATLNPLVFYDQSGNGRNLAGSGGYVRHANRPVCVGRRAAIFGEGDVLSHSSSGVLMSNLITASAGTILWFGSCCKTATNLDPSGAYWTNHGAWRDNGGNLGLMFRTAAHSAASELWTVGAYNHDGGVKAAETTCTRYQATAVAWKIGGGQLSIKLNKGAWSSVASGNVGTLAGYLSLGIIAGEFLHGELIAANVALADGVVDAWMQEAGAYWSAEWAAAGGLAQHALIVGGRQSA